MSTLIVTAHPDPGSLTHRAAHLLREAIGSSGARIAHLAQEGFDPRFTAADRRSYVDRVEPVEAVRSEQRRIDDVEHLVLVFPVFWWSMPALLKGWIDRVFITGWAFDYDEDDRLIPGLARLTVHLLPISGTRRESFDRRGYSQALSTQLEHGVVDFCGANRGATAYVFDAESGDDGAVEASLTTAVGTIAACITAGRTDP